MALINVNPTRMELTRLKKRLVVARRGHRLLKDKRDELMKKFLETIRKAKVLREKVEAQLAEAYRSFLVARAVMSAEAMDEALMLPKHRLELEVGKKNVMSVYVPQFKLLAETVESAEIYPYGFVSTSGDLDAAIGILARLLPQMLELAELEKSSFLLADEIEKTRRRVNALEYVMIPQLEETIRHISMKLDENERGNITRLMKVKDMILEQALESRQKQAVKDSPGIA